MVRTARIIFSEREILPTIIVGTPWIQIVNFVIDRGCFAIADRENYQANLAMHVTDYDHDYAWSGYGSFFFSTLFPRACQLPRRSSIFRLSSIRESNWERETLRIIETYRGHIVQVHTNTHTHTYKVVNATSPYATCRGVIDFSWIRLIGEFLPIIRPPMFKLPFFASRLAIKTERSNRLTICRRNLKKIDSKLIQNCALFYRLWDTSS